MKVYMYEVHTPRIVCTETFIKMTKAASIASMNCTTATCVQCHTVCTKRVEFVLWQCDGVVVVCSPDSPYGHQWMPTVSVSPFAFVLVCKESRESCQPDQQTHDKGKGIKAKGRGHSLLLSGDSLNETVV